MKPTHIVKRMAYFKGKSLLPALISSDYIKTEKHVFPISLATFHTRFREKVTNVVTYFLNLFLKFVEFLCRGLKTISGRSELFNDF